jgi:hypothetical protein
VVCGSRQLPEKKWMAPQDYAKSPHLDVTVVFGS